MNSRSAAPQTTPASEGHQVIQNTEVFYPSCLFLWACLKAGFGEGALGALRKEHGLGMAGTLPAVS